MNRSPAPGGEPRFIGPLGYILQSTCYAGTQVDVIPFVADEPENPTQPTLNERIYIQFRPKWGELHAVVFWRQGERSGRISPDVTVYAELDDTLAAHPALRERAGAFEKAKVRKFPSRSEEEGRQSIHGVVLELPPYHPTPGLFHTGFGEEMPYVRITPVEMGGGYYLLFERRGYRFFSKGTFLHMRARYRPVQPGLLELRQEGASVTAAMQPGGDSRAEFDGFPRFRECLAYTREVHVASTDRTCLTDSTLERATVGPTPGRTPSGLQVYTLQYLKGGATADVVPFFPDGDDSSGRVYVRYPSPEAGGHAVVSWVRDGRWRWRLVVTPFEDRDALVAAYPLLREAVAAAEAGETWRLPPFHAVRDIFQQWRCRNRPEVTVALAGSCSLAFEREMADGIRQLEFVDAAGANPLREEEHPDLKEELDYGRRLFPGAGTVMWQKVLDRRFGAVPGESGTALQVLPIRDQNGQYFLLVRRETKPPSFSLITWPEKERACPVDAAGEYPGPEALLRSHPELEASLMCANQRLIMDCRYARPEGPE